MLLGLTQGCRFKNAADAKMAVEQMNGFELAGRPIRVGIMKDRVDGPSSSYARLECSSINLDDSGIGIE